MWRPDAPFASGAKAVRRRGVRELGRASCGALSAKRCTAELGLRARVAVQRAAALVASVGCRGRVHCTTVQAGAAKRGAHTHAGPVRQRQPFKERLYCPRCVFLNPGEVESPYWHEGWLMSGAMVCQIHRLPLAALKGGFVRRTHNLPHLLKHIGRRELERRELNRTNGRNGRIGTICEPIGTI